MSCLHSIDFGVPMAALIRSDLSGRQLQRVSTLAVEDANAKFYKAFQDSDAEVRPRPTQALIASIHQPLGSRDFRVAAELSQ